MPLLLPCKVIVKFLEKMVNKRVFFKIINLYRIGFGSFSDKAMVPFAMERSRYQEKGNPTPYSFRHHLNLTKDVADFIDLIKKIDGSKNSKGGLISEGILISVVRSETS